MAKKSKDDSGMTPTNINRAMLMFDLINMGVTPDEYKAFYDYLSTIDTSDFLENGNGLNMTKEGGFVLAPLRKQTERKPVSNASDKSLRLKIQMQDVTKPPMWREIIVPADFNFTQLHYAIQAVAGLQNCHLWQFQRKAYDSDYSIGIPYNPDSGYGLDDATDDSDKTPLTTFLAKKDDKIVYVYDFGDDWIFDVKVLEVMPRHEDTAELVKWKSDLQPTENSGGIFTYLNVREIMNNESKMTIKQKKQAAEMLGFDKFSEVKEYLVEGSIINPEYIAEKLSEIPDRWQDFD